MNRWATRILLILLLLFFAFVFASMHRTLVRLNEERSAPASRR
jgi:hypothetical protein